MKKTIVQVSFEGNSKPYSYCTHLDLEKGDVCVVKVEEEFKCCLVKKVSGLSFNVRRKAGKWIVQKVDTEGFNLFMEKMDAVQEIKNLLHERKDEALEMQMFQALGKHDPEIKELLEKLQGIAPELLPDLCCTEDGNEGIAEGVVLQNE